MSKMLLRNVLSAMKILKKTKNWFSLKLVSIFSIISALLYGSKVTADVLSANDKSKSYQNLKIDFIMALTNVFILHSAINIDEIDLKHKYARLIIRIFKF
jgi:hypothetical protein